MRILLAIALFLLGGCSDEKAQAPPRPTKAATAVAANGDTKVARGAPPLDCSGSGRRPEGGYQFLAPCQGRAASPDREFAVAIGGRGGGVSLTDGRGRELGALPSLDDAMPFVLFWAPNSRWFFVDHYLGSGLERLRVFQIVGRAAVERSALFDGAARVMVRHSPCLARHASVVASGRRWSRDGRRIALVAYARTDACFVESRPGIWRPAGHWQALWMIGDAASGRIDPASVRVQRNGGPMPKDGLYAAL